MMFSNKLKPRTWMPLIEAAASEHDLAHSALESWMNGVSLVNSSQWKNLYTPTLSAPRGKGQTKSDSVKPSLIDFFHHMENANNFLSQAIQENGKPKLKVSRWHTYTVAVMNQDVAHFSLQLAFLYWARNMATVIYCDEHGIHGGTFDPYLDSLKAIEAFMGVFEEEQHFHNLIKFGKDVSQNNSDVTDSNILRRADSVLYERAQKFPILADTLETESASLLPWIAGDSKEIDISSFKINASV